MNWTPGAHASTFGGNPVCIAAAMATMDLLESEYLENARRVGAFLLDRLADWPVCHKIVGDVRGKGLMIAIEFEARSKVSLATFADVLRVLEAQPVPLRDVPRRSGVSKEAVSMALGVLVKRGLVAVAQNPVGTPGKAARPRRSRGWPG